MMATSLVATAAALIASPTSHAGMAYWIPMSFVTMVATMERLPTIAIPIVALYQNFVAMELQTQHSSHPDHLSRKVVTPAEIHRRAMEMAMATAVTIQMRNANLLNVTTAIQTWHSSHLAQSSLKVVTPAAIHRCAMEMAIATTVTTQMRNANRLDVATAMQT